MAKQLLITGSNTLADGSMFESTGLIEAQVAGGPHKGHQVKLTTAKHNCGAYEQSTDCSCGKWWQNEMNGCWQFSHQRTESGDDELGKMFTLAYEIIERAPQV